MGRKIIWSDPAKAELRSIRNYWTRRNKSARYSQLLRQEVDVLLFKIAKEPFIGSLTDEANIQKKLLRDYYIFYEVSDTAITVLKVWDTRRNPGDNPYYY